MVFTNMLTFITRPATLNDASAITDMMAALAREEGGKHCLNTSQFVQHMEQGTPELLIYVAMKQATYLGCVIAYKGYDVLSTSCGYHVSDVYVYPQARRQGVARQLLAALAGKGLQEGLEWMSWTVLHTNESAKAFYHVLNAETVGVDFMAMGASSMAHLAKAVS